LFYINPSRRGPVPGRRRGARGAPSGRGWRPLLAEADQPLGVLGPPKLLGKGVIKEVFGVLITKNN